MTKFLPCPFCGKQPKTSVSNYADSAGNFTKLAYCFECPDGCSVSKEAGTYDRAAVVWNTRVPEEASGYRHAFLREEDRADAMGMEVDALREALRYAQNALEMVRDANRDEPHIPAIALSSVELAITICEGVK